MAPMAGVTDPAYRIHDAAAAVPTLAYSEMVSVGGPCLC